MTADKLAAALRYIATLRTNGENFADDNAALDAVIARAADALAEHDKAASDPIRTLVLRHALESYSERMYREAKDQRAHRVGSLAADAERIAQGCDARRRVADELIAELA